MAVADILVFFHPLLPEGGAVFLRNHGCFVFIKEHRQKKSTGAHFQILGADAALSRAQLRVRQHHVVQFVVRMSSQVQMVAGEPG